jgi:hypothetical protein
MARKNKPFPISLLIIAILVLLIYFMKDGSFGIGEGTATEETLQKDTATVNLQPAVTTDRVTEDTVIVPIDSTVTVLDSLNVDEVNSNSTLLTFNTLLVTKRNDSLYYQINEQTYTNLLLGIAETDYTLPFNVKLAGNLTYAEEREIKDILEEKELNFTIEE